MKKENLRSMIGNAVLIIGSVGATIILGGFITDYGNGRFKEGLELGKMAGRAERDIEYLKSKSKEENEETEED